MTVHQQLIKMHFEKINEFQKILLRLRNHEEYRNYRFQNKLQNVVPPAFETPDRDDVHFKHSGNLGDIIYALPAMYTLSKGKKIHLHLYVDQKANYGKMKHPLGTTMLSENMVSLLQPLLLAQVNFVKCDLYNNQPIDFDLDKFREYPFNLRTGNIARWYFLVFGINADLGKPWLHAAANTSIKDAIVIARSFRYRSPGIDYSFLQAYGRTIFVGLQEEYEDIKKMIPKIEYQPVKNFLELASVIAGSKFFIGNQSFPFSIAEGLKVKRIMELYHRSPNVNVEGSKGYDFCYQPQFEKIVNDLFRELNPG